MTQNAYLVAGLRSPIGRFGGALQPLRATDFASIVAAELLKQSNVKPAEVGRVVAGMVFQESDESNPARIVGQRIAIPHTAAAYTIHMQCCSGMAALIDAARQVALGETDCVLALGLESMSNVSHTLPGSRWGYRLQNGAVVDPLREGARAGSARWGDPKEMIEVAEKHAEVDGVSREEMDDYVMISHARALAAMDAGRLDDEIVPIEVPGRRGASTLFARDENPRENLDREALGKLSPVFPGGTITAGNAGSMNDGAAAALVCNDKGLARLGLKPLARILMPGTAMIGCEPNLMGYSCVDALDAALRSAEKSLDDLDLIECNEGFSVQLVACRKAAGWAEERLNVDGGSVALGHPVGMSGLRIAVHLAHALRQRDLDMGGATVPAGSGLGSAVLLERVK